MADVPTGAAFNFVSTEGDNAIIVYTGAAGIISANDVEDARDAIESARVFVTQLEQPLEGAERALQIAHDAGVTTIFNPAPLTPFPIQSTPLRLHPSERKAAALVGFELSSLDYVRRAGDILLERGARSALITLGERGVVFHTADSSAHIPVFSNGPAIDTTGAADAFIGGFAAAPVRMGWRRFRPFASAVRQRVLPSRGAERRLQCRLFRKSSCCWRSRRPYIASRPALSPGLADKHVLGSIADRSVLSFRTFVAICAVLTLHFLLNNAATASRPAPPVLSAFKLGLFTL